MFFTAASSPRSMNPGVDWCARTLRRMLRSSSCWLADRSKSPRGSGCRTRPKISAWNGFRLVAGPGGSPAAAPGRRTRTSSGR